MQTILMLRVVMRVFFFFDRTLYVNIRTHTHTSYRKRENECSVKKQIKVLISNEQSTKEFGLNRQR